MEISNVYRTRHCAVSASSPAVTMWRPLPIFGAAVRLDGGLGFAPAVVEADATASAPGHHAWSPPI